MWINKLKYLYENKLAQDEIASLKQDVVDLEAKVESIKVVKELNTPSSNYLHDRVFNESTLAEKIGDSRALQHSSDCSGFFRQLAQAPFGSILSGTRGSSILGG